MFCPAQVGAALSADRRRPGRSSGTYDPGVLAQAQWQCWAIVEFRERDSFRLETSVVRSGPSVHHAGIAPTTASQAPSYEKQAASDETEMRE